MINRVLVGDTFQPRLVNGPFDDPVLFVDFRYERRALLFDLGRIDGLSTREILRLSDVFISHTHIDHFVGFDQLLRCSLNKEGPISFFGPRGIIENIQGKLAGYTWNWIQEYPIRFVAHEIDGDRITSVRLDAAKRFQSEEERVRPFKGVLLEEPSFTVSSVILDHSIPCLAFCLRESNRLNIRSDRLRSLGVKSGPWLDGLKKMIRQNVPEGTRLEIPTEHGGEQGSRTMKEWRESLILESEGQKIGYVVDCLYSPTNAEQIVSLVLDADLFYCEASFSDADRTRATQRYHLTA